MKEKARIIYIEDEIRDVELVQAQLRGENYPFELKHVENKAELMSELKKNEYDIILMDYSLPSFKPLETIEELKKEYSTKPVIIISGTIGEELAIETLKSGAIDYVLKHRLVRLRPAIERAIQLAREREKRLQAQEKLRQSEEKFRLLAENVTDIIMQLDSEGNYLYVSPSIEEITGHHFSELLGKKCYDYIHPDDKTRVHEAHRQIKISGIAPTIEFRLHCKNGEYKWVESKARKIFAESRENEGTILSVIRDISERKAFEEKLKANLREKELLLNEIHHRVKNNLQIISSLLNLQSARIDSQEAKDGFKKSVYRIRTIAQVHEMLYRSDNLAAIEFVDYAKDLSRTLFIAYYTPDTDLSLQIEGKNTKLGIDKAIPCGLLLNELITNSLKHAFKGKKKGTIKIKFSDLGDSYRLMVADNGVGLPDGFPLKDSMGSKLLRALVDQLEGTLEIDRSQGAKFIITFPKKFRGEK